MISQRGKAVEITQDHRAVSAAERARVMAAGGTVVEDYLNDKLAVTRALGDWHMEVRNDTEVRAATVLLRSATLLLRKIQRHCLCIRLQALGKAMDSIERVWSTVLGGVGCDRVLVTDEGLGCCCCFVLSQDLKRRGDGDGATETTGPLIAEPEVFESLLEEGDEFMVIGCDGLWDSFNGQSQEVINYARRLLCFNNDPSKCSQVSTLL